MIKFPLREQFMVFIISIFLITIGTIWGIQHLKNHEKIMEQKLDFLNNRIKKIRFHTNEWIRVQQKITAPIMLQSLSSFVENVARSIGIQDNLQLNDLTNLEKGEEGIKVGLDSLKLDHFLSMLYRLENHRPVLKISHVKIAISPGERTIRASFHVKKQKKD
tara:strand:+ start:909 stop:1394 length:486 start_codon:yes stop_codon:yes gene_type:complete